MSELYSDFAAPVDRPDMFPVGRKECVIPIQLYYFDDLPPWYTEGLLELVYGLDWVLVLTESNNDLLVEPFLVDIRQWKLDTLWCLHPVV